MNRRGVALVVVVVLAIGFGAWWLSALPVEVTLSPHTPVVEVPRPPAPQPIAPPPAPVVVTPPPLPTELDAGVMAEVEVEVFRGEQQLVGVRVELDGPDGRVSRPTDVMGFARFTLTPGSWRITEPRPLKLPKVPYDGGSATDWYAAMDRAWTTPLEVTAPLTRFRMSLPAVRRIHGRVVDSRQQPAPGVDVRWSSFTLRESTVTDTLGQFTIETTEEAVQVQAKRGSARSMVRRATGADLVTLVLEEWTQLKVTATPDRGGCLYVRVMQGDEIVAVCCDSEPMLVPVGHLTVLARRNIKGQPHSARGRIDTKAGIENQLELELSPTPPITGTLVDAHGQPMPGVGLHIRLVEFEYLDKQLEPLGAPREPSLKTLLRRSDAGIPALPAITRTDLHGQFTWTPGGGGGPDPIFQVLAVELWQTKSEPVLVKLDDAPLSIVVEPATR